MGKFMYKDQPYGGASSYATAVECIDKDGNNSTVQAELNNLYTQNEWKLYTLDAPGGTTILLPNEWSELSIYCYNTVTKYTTTHHILKIFFDRLDIPSINIANGYYYTSNTAACLNYISKADTNAIYATFTSIGEMHNANGLVTIYYK